VLNFDGRSALLSRWFEGKGEFDCHGTLVRAGWCSNGGIRQRADVKMCALSAFVSRHACHPLRAAPVFCLAVQHLRPVPEPTRTWRHPCHPMQLALAGQALL
jgi:hypothetical protein